MRLEFLISIKTQILLSYNSYNEQAKFHRSRKNTLQIW